MRFMLFMHPAVRADGPGGLNHPDATEAVAAMGRFNEELLKAGVLLALDGLHPLEEGARVSFASAGASVVDGPFAEAKELVGGYWLIQVKDKAEAVEWASRCPAGEGDMIEVRRVYEASDWGELPEEVGGRAGIRHRTPSGAPREQTSAS